MRRFYLCELSAKFITELDPKTQLLGGQAELVIPMLGVYDKTSRGKVRTQDLPLLLDYGVVIIDSEEAPSYTFLDKVKSSTKVISNWVINTSSKGKVVATITEREFKNLLLESSKARCHSGDPDKDLYPGMVFILRVYPYEGLVGRVVSIDKNYKSAKVLLEYGNQLKDIPVSQLLYSIYDNMGFLESPVAKAVYLEDLNMHYSGYSEKLLYKNNHFVPEDGQS